jgi:hypothetical protein
MKLIGYGIYTIVALNQSTISLGLVESTVDNRVLDRGCTKSMSAMPTLYVFLEVDAWRCFADAHSAAHYSWLLKIPGGSMPHSRYRCLNVFLLNILP